MQFKDALQRLLAQEGISKEHLAAATGKSVFAVTAWLRGDNEPKIGDVLRIRKSYPAFSVLLDEVAA